jgi:hypothetical protein
MLIHQSLMGAQIVPAPPTPRMSIVVVEGEAAINNIRQKARPAAVIVRVRDGNRNPVAGASVKFMLPAEGPGAQFADGSNVLTVTADRDGYASARDLQPNNAPGRYLINVEAEDRGQTASTSVTQFNMAVESGGGGSGKWIAIVALIGGAAAGGAVAAMRGSGQTATTPTIPAIGITPGPGTVGPPR